MAKTSNRTVASTLLQGLVERGYGANQALSYLRSIGLGYRRQDFLADYRQARGIVEKSAGVKNINMDKIPTDRVMNSIYHGLPDHYGYMVSMEVISPDTGEREKRYRWYFTDFLGTRRQIENRISDYYEKVEKTSGTVVSVQLERIDVNPYWESIL